MTIASAIATKQQQVADSYTAVSNKGGTLPTTQNLTNLATAISSIPSGGDTPTLISKTITQNGTYNASSDNADGYSSVTVNVSGSSIGIPREVKNGVYQMPTENFTFSLPSDATDVGASALQYAFLSCTGLTSIDLSSLTTISGSSAFVRAFYGCTGLTSIDLSSLTTIPSTSVFQYAFYNCTGLTSIDLSSLTTISGSTAFQYAFYNCTGLTSIDLSSLTTISGSSAFTFVFNGCTRLTSIDLSSLTTISGSSAFEYAFYNCTGLTDIYFRALTTTSFGSYKNQFQNMMSGTGASKTHTLHFPSNMQSTISGLTGYPLFGGRSGYVTLSFDLPATS